MARKPVILGRGDFSCSQPGMNLFPPGFIVRVVEKRAVSVIYSGD